MRVVPDYPKRGNNNRRPTDSEQLPLLRVIVPSGRKSQEKFRQDKPDNGRASDVWHDRYEFFPNRSERFYTHVRNFSNFSPNVRREHRSRREKIADDRQRI